MAWAYGLVERPTTANPQVSGVRVRAQVKRDFNPVSISCGYRVSCAEMLGVDGFLARWVA